MFDCVRKIYVTLGLIASLLAGLVLLALFDSPVGAWIAGISTLAIVAARFFLPGSAADLSDIDIDL